MFRIRPTGVVKKSAVHNIRKTPTKNPIRPTMDYMTAAVPPRYRIDMTDGTSAGARTQQELVGHINTHNNNEVANRQLVRSALRGSTAPWFLRNLAAIHVQNIVRL